MVGLTHALEAPAPDTGDMCDYPNLLTRRDQLRPLLDMCLGVRGDLDGRFVDEFHLQLARLPTPPRLLLQFKLSQYLGQQHAVPIW